MIRTKLGMILGTGLAVLAIGIFGGIRSANAAVISPLIDKQIRPYVTLGFGGGYTPACNQGYTVDVPVYGGHRDWDRDRDFHRDWNRDGDRDFHRDWGRDGDRDFHRDGDRDGDHDRGRDFRGADRDDHGGWGHR